MTCIEMGKELMRNSSCQHSFVLKVAPNPGKRYSELPKAIPCNNDFKTAICFRPATEAGK